MTPGVNRHPACVDYPVQHHDVARCGKVHLASTFPITQVLLLPSRRTTGGCQQHDSSQLHSNGNMTVCQTCLTAAAEREAVANLEPGRSEYGAVFRSRSCK